MKTEIKSKQKLPWLDVMDLDTSFENIRKGIALIEKRIDDLGFEYVNKIKGENLFTKNDSIYRLRNSIQYRLRAILFHFTLLLDIQIKFQERIDEDPYNKEESIKWMILGKEQQYALFDSIIFHIISLFDYLGNLIDYILCGKSQSRLKWNGVIGYSYDKNSLLSDTSIKYVLQKWHSQFINVLYDHRSDLIHYKIDFGASEYIIDLGKSKANLIIESPYRFINKFKELKNLSAINKISINYSVEWLIKKTMEASEEIIESIFKAIEEAQYLKKKKSFKNKGRI